MKVVLGRVVLSVLRRKHLPPARHTRVRDCTHTPYRVVATLLRLFWNRERVKTPLYGGHGELEVGLGRLVLPVLRRKHVLPQLMNVRKS